MVITGYSVSYGPALRFCQPGVVIVPGGQTSDLRQFSRKQLEATHDVQPRWRQVQTMRRHLYKASKLVPFMNFVLQVFYN